MSWAADLNKLTSSGGRELETLARVVKIKLFTGIVKLTRVDTGRLKGNWQIQNHTYSPKTLTTLDKTGVNVISPSNLNKIEKGSLPSSVTYFTNNLPYAKKYEEIDGMVGRSAARVRLDIQREIRRIKAKI